MTPEPLNKTPEPLRAGDVGSAADAGGEPGAWLSALADGDAQALERACSHWREDHQARKTWHVYHVIGDVMRSEELARPAARDAAFVASLRTRLAAEPVVLAPAPMQWRRRRGAKGWWCSAS